MERQSCCDMVECLISDVTSWVRSIVGAKMILLIRTSSANNLVEDEMFSCRAGAISSIYCDILAGNTVSQYLFLLSILGDTFTTLVK